MPLLEFVVFLDLLSPECRSTINTNVAHVLVGAPDGIFGVPLQVSIKYANVAISLQNENGENYVYGYVPIVIAKCGVYLKERGKGDRNRTSSSVLMFITSYGRRRHFPT